LGEKLGRPVPLDNVATIALVCSALVILTTVHAQDFPDVEGDRATGRKTFPIVAPRIARFGMLPLLVTWSAVLSIMWRLDYVWTTAIMALSTYVGTRYLRYSGKSQDKTSYRWYNVSMIKFGVHSKFTLLYRSGYLRFTLCHCRPDWLIRSRRHQVVSLAMNLPQCNSLFTNSYLPKMYASTC
jgi:hypothetical protein